MPVYRLIYVFLAVGFYSGDVSLDVSLQSDYRMKSQMLSIERVAEVSRYQRITAESSLNIKYLENVRKNLLDTNETILLFSHVP
jgi:hypothetical protein